MVEKQIIKSIKAPAAIGPYSVAVRLGEFVFAAGQLGLDPQTGNLVPGGVEAETRQALTNLQNVLEAAGSSLDLAVKTTVFMKDMNDFTKMNTIYGEFFKEKYPARSTVQVAALPKQGAIEIEVIAVVKN
jgi:2-iminobutanoate/2-iminopropanoate deaminase